MALVLTQGSALFFLDDSDANNEVRKIKGITNMGSFSPSVTKIPATDLDSVAVESILGLIDNGSITYGYNFHADDASQAAVKGKEGSSTNYRFVQCAGDGTVIPVYSTPGIPGGTFTLPTNAERTSWDYMAGVESMTTGGGTDDAYRGDLNLSVSGAVTLTRKNA